MLPSGTFLDRAAHWNPIAVRCDDQDRPFLGRGRRLEGVPELNYEAAEFSVYVL